MAGPGMAPRGGGYMPGPAPGPGYETGMWVGDGESSDGYEWYEGEGYESFHGPPHMQGGGPHGMGRPFGGHGGW